MSTHQRCTSSWTAFAKLKMGGGGSRSSIRALGSRRIRNPNGHRLLKGKGFGVARGHPRPTYFSGMSGEQQELNVAGTSRYVGGM